MRCKTFVKHFRQVGQFFVFNTTHQLSTDELEFLSKKCPQGIKKSPFTAVKRLLEVG